jgi:hypothetical protein
VKFRRRKKKRISKAEGYVSICAWCSKEIPEDTEVFSIGAKANQGIDLKEQEGCIIPLPLHVVRKIVPAMIVNSDSHAKKDGYDIVFMVCSQSCSTELRQALNEEIEVGRS